MYTARVREKKRTEEAVENAEGEKERWRVKNRSETASFFRRWAVQTKSAGGLIARETQPQYFCRRDESIGRHGFVVVLLRNARKQRLEFAGGWRAGWPGQDPAIQHRIPLSSVETITGNGDNDALPNRQSNRSWLPFRAIACRMLLFAPRLENISPVFGYGEPTFNVDRWIVVDRSSLPKYTSVFLSSITLYISLSWEIGDSF